MSNVYLKPPTNNGWCAVYYKYINGKERMYVIENSYSKRKAIAQRYADEFMLVHQVQTYVTECIY